MRGSGCCEIPVWAEKKLDTPVVICMYHCRDTIPADIYCLKKVSNAELIFFTRVFSAKFDNLNVTNGKKKIRLLYFTKTAGRDIRAGIRFDGYIRTSRDKLTGSRLTTSISFLTGLGFQPPIPT